MKRFKFVVMICCFVFVALAITPRVKADEWNNKSFLTFSEPLKFREWAPRSCPPASICLSLWTR